MSDLDQLIIRTWSALTARGEDASASAIADRVGLDVLIVQRRLVDLRVKGQLP